MLRVRSLIASMVTVESHPGTPQVSGLLFWASASIGVCIETKGGNCV